MSFEHGSVPSEEGYSPFLPAPPKLVEKLDVAEVYFNHKLLGYEFENRAINTKLKIIKCESRFYVGSESILLT